MSTQVNKLYPKMGKDKSGLKFYFDSNEKHYTIRFAGNPILLLEFIYKRNGGDMEKFKLIYDIAKGNYQKFQKTEQDINNLKILEQSTKEVNDILSLFQDISVSGLSPFSIYVNDLNNFK